MSALRPAYHALPITYSFAFPFESRLNLNLVFGVFQNKLRLAMLRGSVAEKTLLRSIN
jgi:hypothetical protein